MEEASRRKLTICSPISTLLFFLILSHYTERIQGNSKYSVRENMEINFKVYSLFLSDAL
jgi:hypothetical protein